MLPPSRLRGTCCPVELRVLLRRAREGRFPSARYISKLIGYFERTKAVTEED